MERFRMMRQLWILAVVGPLLGCSNLGIGSDGSFHPDATANFANYTGQGDGGTGWAGDEDGEGGPSAIPPVADDKKPH